MSIIVPGLVYPGFQILYPKQGWINWSPWYKWGPATGGSTSQFGNDLVHTFDTPGTYSFTTYWTINVQYLVVGGGGGAGYGSGGAGGMLEGTMTLTPGTYTITVGGGGSGRTGTYQSGDNGGNSQFHTVTSLGGGGGGNYLGRGTNGGSGGGGSYQSYSGAGTSGQGNNGSNYFYNYYGAGGGAGGAAYWDGTYNYPGPAKWSSISGTNLPYAMGGNTPYTNRGGDVPGKGGNYYGQNGRSGIVILRYNVAPIEEAYRKWVQENYTEKLKKLEEAKNKEIKALETENEELIAEAKKEREELEKEIQDLETRNNALEEKIKVVETKLQLSEEELAKKKQELTETKLEYEKKLNALKDAQAKEKEALEAENEKLAQEAKTTQLRLTDDLMKLKADYENISALLQGKTSQLMDVQQTLVNTKSEYEGKLSELKAAKEAEVASLKEQNKEAAEMAQKEQQRLIEDLTKLKSKYETLQQDMAKCPIIPEESVVLDGQTGTLYKFQSGALREFTFEAYKSHGSPRYTTYPPGKLNLCAKGPPMDEITQPPTPTSTESPTETPSFDTNIYIFVHAQSWDENNTLRVMSYRFGSVSLDSFKYRDVSQAWMISNNGQIRSLSGNGEYITNNDSCLAPIMVRDVPRTSWTLRSNGTSYLENLVISSCGTYLTADVGNRAIGLEGGIDKGSRWYIVPVGTARM